MLNTSSGRLHALSVRTRHAHPDRDFQVADNDRGITRRSVAGHHDAVRQTALPRTIGVFGLALERRGVLDPHLGPRGNGLELQTS